MPVYELTLNGFHAHLPQDHHLVKWVQAEDRPTVDAFVNEYKIPLSPSIPVSTLQIEDEHEDIDVILDEEGEVIFGDAEWWKDESKAAKNDKNNIYIGHANNSDWYVTKNGKKLSPAKSLKVHNHSPDGFAWGYGGSGPAQLALALLLEETGSPEFATKYYQLFKEQVIAMIEQDGDFGTCSVFIRDFLHRMTTRDLFGKKDGLGLDHDEV